MLSRGVNSSPGKNSLLLADCLAYKWLVRRWISSRDAYGFSRCKHRSWVYCPNEYQHGIKYQERNMLTLRLTKRQRYKQIYKTSSVTYILAICHHVQLYRYALVAAELTVIAEITATTDVRRPVARSKLVNYHSCVKHLWYHDSSRMVIAISLSNNLIVLKKPSDRGLVTCTATDLLWTELRLLLIRK